MHGTQPASRWLGAAAYSPPAADDQLEKVAGFPAPHDIPVTRTPQLTLASRTNTLTGRTLGLDDIYFRYFRYYFLSHHCSLRSIRS